MKGGVTKAEHDAEVERRGRPYTQGPIKRHIESSEPLPADMHVLAPTRKKKEKGT